MVQIDTRWVFKYRITREPYRSPSFLTEEEELGARGGRSSVAATLEPPLTAKKDKNSPIRSEFNFEHLHGQIKIKGPADEPKTVNKTWRRCRGKNKKLPPMRPLPIPVSRNFSTVVINVFFSKG